MTIIKVNSKVKYLIFALLLSSSAFTIDNETPGKNNNEQETINAQDDSYVSNAETAKLLDFFQKTFEFLKKNKYDVAAIGDFFSTFSQENKNFNEVMQKFLQATGTGLTITQQECVLVLRFLTTLITKINTEKNLGLKIKEIDFLKIADNKEILINELDSFLNSIPEINNLELSLEEDAEGRLGISLNENIIDILSDLNSRIATLLKKITDNLQQKNYNKSFLKKISSTYFKENKDTGLFNLQYTEMIKQFTEECLRTIQENVFLLNSIRNDFFSLSEKKQYEYIGEILEKNLFVLSFVKYQLTKKFLPTSEEKEKFQHLEKKLKQLIKNKEATNKIQAIEKEQQNLFVKMQDRIISGTKKKAEEIKQVLYKRNTEESINKKVEKLITIARELTDQEQSLCFYPLQNMYRSVYFNTQLFLEKNIVTKGLKYLLTNPEKIFSAYFAYDMYKFLDPAKRPESSYLSMISSRIMEIYKDFHTATPSIEKTPFLYKQDFYNLYDQLVFGSNIAQRNIATQLDTSIKSINESLNSETDISKKAYLEEQKSKLVSEKAKLDKQISNGLTRNYSPYLAEMIQAKEKIEVEENQFDQDLKTGKFKDYSLEAKKSIQNNVTIQEIENPALLEERYKKDYMTLNNISEINQEGKEKIKKQVKQALEVIKIHENMQERHMKLIHPYIAPYPLRNVGRNIKLIGPLALPVTAGIFGLITNNYLKKIEGAVFGGPKKLIQNLHLLAMGEKVEAENNIKLVQEEDFKYDLYDKTFDVWRSQGLLDWFDAVIKEVKKVYAEPNSTISPELDRAILVIGESGSGKTTLVNAWLKSLTKEANQSGKVEVEFFQIDPKMFTKEVQTEPGRYEKMDLFAEAKGYLKSIKFANKVVVIHIDEAHLLLGTNEGTFSLTRWADLLNFITSLNDEQRKNKSRGAMFIIASTNRPDILPPEILKNPNRFSNIIEIPIPSYTDRISILKGYLKNLGMQTDHIDFEYLSGLLEGTNQSYGNVLRIVQKSVVFAKIYNSMVTTEILYKFINELIRNVTFTINKLDPYFVDQISSYYGAIASVAMQFEKVQNLYSFDMATIYPLKNEIESKNISELYAYPKPKSIQFGEVFYCKRSFQIDDFNKKIVILSLIADLVGTIYCDSVDCGLPRQAQKKLAHAYSQIYEYFASSSAEFAHIATEFQKSKQGDSATDITLTKKTTDILRKIEIEIKKFVQQSDVKQLIEKTKELLQNKKMITKKDMLEQNEIKNLLIKTEKEFKTLYNTIKNLIV